MKKIAIFASGSGTNAENLANFFRLEEGVEVALIGTNKKNAFVLERAKKLGVPSLIFSNQTLQNETDFLISELRKASVDYLVLAGFLLKIPGKLIQEFPNKIINIHPALLPNYGGKGMYGMHVHEAVINSKDPISGITIHLVNEEYDKGRILHQAKCDVNESDSAETLAKKIHELEYEYFPKVVKDYIMANKK